MQFPLETAEFDLSAPSAESPFGDSMALSGDFYPCTNKTACPQGLMRSFGHAVYGLAERWLYRFTMKKGSILLYCLKCCVECCNQVVGILDTDGKPDGVGTDALIQEFFLGQL